MTKSDVFGPSAVSPNGRRADFSSLARLARGGLLSLADAKRVWQISENAVAARLARYQQRGWLKRVRRGLYLVVPLEADPRTGVTVEDSWLLAQRLFSPCYIGGWSAAGHWGLSEQIFRSVFVVSAASVRVRKADILRTQFKVVRTSLRHVARAGTIWRGREKVPVSDPELTLADALGNPSWMGGVRHLAEVLSTYRESSHWQANKLVMRVKERGSGAAFKRLGWLTEHMFPEEHSLVATCLANITKGVVSLDPAVTTPGHIVSRWALRVNVDVVRSPGD